MEKQITFRGYSPASVTRVPFENRAEHRVFLLSPAHLKGRRVQRLCRPDTASELGMRLRGTGVPLAELFCFASSLYFRGKLAYARMFAVPPVGLEGCYIITSSRGLLGPESLVNLALLEEWATFAELDPDEDRYRVPLQRDAMAVGERLGDVGQAVLLGSIATPKYVAPLLEVFGQRLAFPCAFVGLGNMSRGGLLLRCVRAKKELAYSSAAGPARVSNHRKDG